jgi:hypothetical protein
MYRVMVQLQDGEFLLVAHRESLDEAAQLIEELGTYWPRTYLVLDTSGNEVDFAGQAPIGPEPHGASRVSQL